MSDNTNLSSDIYQISDFIVKIKQQFSDINEDTLFMGLFGYTGEVFSSICQNAIVMASEYSNEGIPYKAKFEKNIITHALSLGFTDINAVPPAMNILLGFVEEDLISNMSNNRFIFDKDNAFFIEDFEFHLDYDVIITRNFLTNNRDTYTARYNMVNKNPVSSINNPYLSPPVRMKSYNENIIYIQCTIRQVEERKIYKKMLTDNALENKTISFDFDSQLAAFDIDVKEGNTITHLVPIYEGLYTNIQEKFCYYSYIDANTIRIKFNRDSYEPRINSDVTINLKTTQGVSGNFTYKDDLSYMFDSEKYNYSNLSCTVRPISDSQFGTNKKSITDLKRIIPKEASSRGSITNTTDLENFFNMLDTDSNKVYFYKKRDNQLERLYYSYIILKNSLNNIIPTNTISMKIYEDEFSSSDESLVLETGNTILHHPDYAIIEKTPVPPKPGEVQFRYTTPFLMVINKNPLYVSYYMNIMNMNKYLDFTYINDFCTLQFICTSVNWKREYLTNRNTYKLEVPIMQNITEDVGMIEEVDGKITKCNIKVIAVMYKDNVPYRYAESTLLSYDKNAFIYKFGFDFTTQDIINKDSLIRIENVYDINSASKSYGYFDGNTKVTLYILSKQDKEYGRDDADIIIPGLEGYTLSNKYTITNGLDFFYNYTHIVSSTVKPFKETVTIPPAVEGGQPTTAERVYYKIDSIPVVRNTYVDTESKIRDFTYQLDKRKEYIDYALNIIEDGFGVDFKFFNTYGPSTQFQISEGQLLNSVNLKVKFRVKFINSSDNYLVDYMIQDIKKYIEDINAITDLHIPNLITLITNTYRDQIVYFEFLDMNGYGPGYQHIYNAGSNSLTDVPEFLNIDNNSNGNPNIEIAVV